MPGALGPVAQVVQGRFRARELGLVVDPDLRQALVGRQLTEGAAEELALHARRDAIGPQGMGPQRGDGEIGSLGEAAHGDDDGVAAAYVQTLLAQPDFLEWSAEALR